MRNSHTLYVVALTTFLFLFSCNSSSESKEAAPASGTGQTTAAAEQPAEPEVKAFATGTMPPRGSKIYIAPAGKANKVGPHLSNAIQTAGYWTTVSSKEDADFIMQPVVEEKGMSINGHVVLKNLDDSSFMQSPKFKAVSFAGNGFSAWRGFGTQVGKWLKGGQ